MPNYCTIGKPVGWGGTDAQWINNNVSYGGIKAPEAFFQSARGAVTTPWLFNADEFNIVCTAFPTAGSASDPIISQAAGIANLQSAVANLQSQVTALTPAGAASSAGGVMTSEIQVEYFTAILAFLVVVWLGDRVRRYFWRDGGEHV